MLNFSNRKAAEPAHTWRTLSKNRCEAHLAEETECPASDCGWDALHQASIKTDCLVCDGKGKLFTFLVHPFLAIVVWANEKFFYPVLASGIEMGDCTLGIEQGTLWLIEQVLAQPRSFLKVDGKIVRPTGPLAPNIIPGIGEAHLVGCKYFNETNG